MNSVFLNSHQLTDNGWEHMASLLDKEMPQPRKRRPFIWWAAVAVLTGLFLIYENQYGEHLQGTNTPSPDSNVSAGAANSLEGVFSSRNPGVNNAVDLKKGVSIATPSGNTTSAAISGHQLRMGTISKGVTANVAAVKNIPSSNNVLTNPELSPEALITAYFVPDNAGINGSLFKTEKLNLSKIPYPAIHLTNTPDLPELQEWPLSPKMQKLAQKKPVLKISLGLMAGANAFQVKQVPGFVGGITADLLLRRRKFGLQTGLLYRYQVFSGESRPVIPIAYDKYVRATANYDIQPKSFPNSWIYLSAKNSVLIPVMKSHQIELPVMLFWQMHSRWRLYAGMSVLRHVWVQSADKGLFTYDLQVVTTPDADAAGNLNNAITGQLPAWEKNWQAGFSFKPLKRLELGLFYRSAWKGKPLLADASTLFDGCSTCHDSYPEAAQRTGQSLRPRSMQLNATFKF